MKGLLIYLFIGLLLGLILEVAWPSIREEEEELTLMDRGIMVFFWPLIILLGVVQYLADTHDENDNDQGPRTGWSS